ncbi:MAG TPA: hypothetical protein VMD30_02110, partial [Tepidisphaeraceae bacterium]|nr:hypothetical protein [Tepidisphaeraceae bacterium]
MELPADSVNEDSADSTAGAASPSAAASDSPPPGAGRCVCPFCGKIHSRSEPACPQCKMENTAANRAAARTRAGPWHLLIAATPNAAGIKWDALLEMVAKGQITLRTVVRGPSTNQLWRFAGRTRGLSREFGICYGCGRAISRTTEICPECQRWQLPPADPDALLEDHEEQGKPVYRQVGQPTGAAAAPAPPQATSAPSRTSQGATLPETSHGPASPVAPAAHGALPKALLTPKELAAAFSLEFPPPQPKYRRMGLRRAVTIALPLAAI